jgi:hypothetical protein
VRGIRSRTFFCPEQTLVQQSSNLSSPPFCPSAEKPSGTAHFEIPFVSPLRQWSGLVRVRGMMKGKTGNFEEKWRARLKNGKNGVYSKTVNSSP